MLDIDTIHDIVTADNDNVVCRLLDIYTTQTIQDTVTADSDNTVHQLLDIDIIHDNVTAGSYDAVHQLLDIDIVETIHDIVPSDSSILTMLCVSCYTYTYGHHP